VDLADRGLLKFENGVSNIVNTGRKREAVVLEGYPGHHGCSCNRSLEDLRTLRQGAHEKQGGRGLKIPAPGGVM
jgi:hypothetical protein